MKFEEFTNLEKKVAALVESVKVLKDENTRLRLEIDKIKNDFSAHAAERTEVKQKITALIQLIDSIDK